MGNYVACCQIMDQIRSDPTCGVSWNYPWLTPHGMLFFIDCSTSWNNSNTRLFGRFNGSPFLDVNWFTYDAKKWSACSIVPWNAVLPLASSTTWWNSSNTPEAGWWTEQITSFPPMASFRRRATTAAAPQLSNPVVGSSQKRIGGSFKS